MKIVIDNDVYILMPDDGFTYIKNGDVYAKIAIVGVESDINLWRDTNEEPLDSDDEFSSEDEVSDSEALSEIIETLKEMR